MDPVAEVAAAVLRDLGADAADWRYDGLPDVVTDAGAPWWHCPATGEPRRPIGGAGP